jgi:hypothetical protein
MGAHPDTTYRGKGAICLDYSYPDLLFRNPRPSAPYQPDDSIHLRVIRFIRVIRVNYYLLTE